MTVTDTQRLAIARQVVNTYPHLGLIEWQAICSLLIQQLATTGRLVHSVHINA